MHILFYRHSTCRYCVYSIDQWSKSGFFAPQGRHVVLINVKFEFGKESIFMFVGAEMWECSSENRQNLEFCPQICSSGSTRLNIFNEILSICTRHRKRSLYVCSLVAFRGHTSISLDGDIFPRSFNTT